jgi:hypothetical protein
VARQELVLRREQANGSSQLFYATAQKRSRKDVLKNLPVKLRRARDELEYPMRRGSAVGDRWSLDRQTTQRTVPARAPASRYLPSQELGISGVGAVMQCSLYGVAKSSKLRTENGPWTR